MSKMHDPANGPCRPMRPLLQALSEGKLKGLMRWYTSSHAAQCPRCAAALKDSTKTAERLIMTSGQSLRLVKKHPLAIRWMHWINFPVLFVMIWSGTLILWSYPGYPTPKHPFQMPDRISLYKWGVMPVYGTTPDSDNKPVPANKRYDIETGFRLGEGMAWHWNFAWFFTLNGVAYLLFLYFSGEWRYLVPRPESFREAFIVVLHDVGLHKKPLPPGKFNHAQRIAYSGVIFLGILMVTTGLAIYKPAQLNWLAQLLGGYQAARLEHFIITWLFLAFFFVHISQVIKAGWNNFRAMITGFEIERTPGTAEVVHE